MANRSIAMMEVGLRRMGICFTHVTATWQQALSAHALFNELYIERGASECNSYGAQFLVALPATAARPHTPVLILEDKEHMNKDGLAEVMYIAAPNGDIETAIIEVLS